ncbi:MAG: 2-C-methyl-D-erythritol 2,4-cyclodiphosphate synthase [Microthrixaceae bacterium]
MSATTWTIVVAAGRGVRFGGAKQFARVAGRTVLEHALDRARRCTDGVVLVVPPGTSLGEAVGEDDAHRMMMIADAVVEGGASRSDSVRRGLDAVPTDVAYVLVHDAARPATPPEVFERVLAALRGGADAAVPVLGLGDTIVTRGGAPLDRSELVAVQTPQGFRAEVLRAAHAGEGDATDDAGLVRRLGTAVAQVAGSNRSLKVTEPGDLDLVAAVLDPAAAVRVVSPRLRVGNGFDVHRVEDPAAAGSPPVAGGGGGTLVLGGVRFEGERALVGHSDGDVVAHACAEALLGAAGLGDLGSHFPDTDRRFAGADSIGLLAKVAAEVRSNGDEIATVDCSVVCDRPRLGPVRERMQQRLGEAIGAPVSVKGRRSEGIGALGRQEGIVAMASALLYGAVEVADS